MKNYRGEDNIEIINQYIYIINNLFIGKEVLVQYYNNTTNYSLWMGINEYDIDLPKEETQTILDNLGIFELESSSRNQDSYVLKDISILKKWCNHQANNYLLNPIDIKKFEPAIQKLRRIKNLEKLL